MPLLQEEATVRSTVKWGILVAAILLTMVLAVYVLGDVTAFS
jgi:hypothetical protein